MELPRLFAMDYSEILSSIKPTAKEHEKVMKAVQSVMKKLKMKNPKPLLGGSIAKGTWLKGNNDIDIYVRFSSSNNNISEQLQNSLKNFKGVKKVHGSRDYFQLKENGFLVELIPILEIQSPKDAENITDVSPFHVEWVTKSMLKNLQLQDQVRLAKSFLDTAGVYGAESYIHGFSGYSTEILVIHYNGFEKFIKAAAKWKGKMIIDPLKQYKDNPLVHLNPAKTSGKLVLIDPVQKDRNAASSVSEESYDKFVEAAKKFVMRQSLSFFHKQKANASKLKKAGNFVIMLKPLKGSDDVIGTKLYKCHLYMLNLLKLEGFGVKENGFEFDGKKAVLWYKPLNRKLPDKMRHSGPPEVVKHALLNFIKKWGTKNVKYEKGRSYVMVKRKFTVPRKFLLSSLNSAYVKERSVSRKLL